MSDLRAKKIAHDAKTRSVQKDMPYQFMTGYS